MRHFWWKHFGAGRHFWRDLYRETAGFRLTQHARAETKSKIIQKLRGEDEAWMH